jgi:predicted anti-sigma-YlaC factor YlaD
MAERILIRRFVGATRFCSYLLLAAAIGSGCSITGYVKNKAAEVVAQSGTTFASDDDPELIKAAAPFSLKLMEGLLADNPRHTGLLTATASGFTQFSYAFVQQEADEVEPTNFAAAEKMRARARRLYLRAQRYGVRGLEVNHPGFSKNLLANPKAAVRVATKADVPLLYWTAAALGSAISLSQNNPQMVGQIPVVEALIYRALELDESFDDGAIHTFLITFEMSRPGVPGDAVARARAHFDRAMALSHGESAAPLVALAEAVTIQNQNVHEFESLLNQALAINPEAQPDTQLLNTVMQNRARWLLSRKSELFLVE